MALSKKIGITITADASKAEKAFDSVARRAEQTAESTGKLADFMSGPSGLAFSFNQFSAVAEKAVQVMTKAAEVADHLSQRALNVSNVFGNLQFGIEGARKATAGLISDFDLAVSANQAFSLGVAQDSKTFAELAQAAQVLGARINQGPKESLDSLVAAVGRGSTAMLDNLGIVLKTEEAHRLYAAQLGKSTKELSDNEKAEAFRKVAITKIIDAAKGVTVETDNAAAAVQRFKVELQNIEDRALGAEDKTTDLNKALQAYVSTQNVNIDSLRKHRVSVYELEDALESAGVSTKDLNKDSETWVRLVIRAQKQVEQYRKDQLVKYRTTLEGIAEVTNQLLEIERQSQAATAGIASKQRLMDIERELALHGNRKDRQAEINRLLNEQAELTAKQLELEGKLDEASRVRFENELRQIRAANSGGGGGGRRRKDPWADGTYVGMVGDRGSLAQAASDRADFQDQFSGVQMSRAGQQLRSAQDDQKIQQLEERQKRMSEFDEFARRQLEESKRREKEEADAVQRAEEVKRREIERTMQTRIQIANTIQSISAQGVSTLQMATDSYIRSERRREFAAKASAGGQAIGIGILETVKAVASFAGQNYVEGAAHTAAAAFAFARGGMLLNQAGGGGRGGFGGSAGAPAFASGSAFGDGGGTAANEPTTTTDGSGRPGPRPPISEEGVQQSGQGGRGGGGMSRSERDHRQVNITVFGRLSEADKIRLRRELLDSTEVTRRVG